MNNSCITDWCSKTFEVMNVERWDRGGKKGCVIGTEQLKFTWRPRGGPSVCMMSRARDTEVELLAKTPSSNYLTFSRKSEQDLSLWMDKISFCRATEKRRGPSGSSC